MYDTGKNTEAFDENDDKIIKMLMAEYMTQKYEEYSSLSEELTENPPFEESPDLDRRCLSAMRKAYYKSRAQQIGKKAFNIFQKVSAAVLTIILIGIVTLAISPTAQAHVITFFATAYGNDTAITFDESRGEPPRLNVNLENSTAFGYIIPPAPDGFEFVKQSADSTDYSVAFEKPSSNANTTLHFSIVQMIGGTYYFDTEDAQVATIELNGMEGYYCEKTIIDTLDNRKSITLIDSNLQIIITVFGLNIDKETLFSFAEQIKPAK